MGRIRFSNHGWMLILAALCLSALGLVMIFSVTGGLLLSKHYASMTRAATSTVNTRVFLISQSIYIMVGMFFAVVAAMTPVWLTRKLVKPAIVGAFVLLVTVLFLGVNVNGAHRWFQFMGFSFQPMEIAKIALILYLAYIIEKRVDLLEDPWKGFGQPLLITGLMIVLLLMQPDFGSAVLFIVVATMMLFVAGSRLYYFALAAAVSLPLLWYYMVAGWRLSKRIIPFLHPEYFSQGASYQIIRSLDAFGSGGVWGYGLGDGPYKMDFLPEAHTDYIAAMIGQELGFAGVAFMIALYALFLYAGVRIAWSHRDSMFRFLLGLGLSLMLVLQALINLSVVMNLIPSKGITLPFVSFGGSSMLISYVSLGLLLSLDREHCVVLSRGAAGAAADPRPAESVGKADAKRPKPVPA
ncbi:putative lipid II flippase FtsW [Myxococcota bacterium]|nr:putative lipid II flippase FtsW [Myxococcota bacterium]